MDHKESTLFYPVIRKKRMDITMLQKKCDEVEYLQFQHLSQIDGFSHLFSTRLGGVSEGIFSSMNLSFTRGDKKEDVLSNFQRIAKVLDANINQFVLSDQTHTCNIIEVTKEDGGNGLTKSLPYHDVDGLVTNVPGLVLSTFYADCVPIFLIDPIHKAIGLCHSGWKGTVLEIGFKTVMRMHDLYGSNPEDIYAGIAPSICQDCYEVSEDVIIEIRKTFDNHFEGDFDKGYENDLCEKLFYAKENGKYQLNLWNACEASLRKAGVLKEHIEMTDICTCCNKEYLFSHRASQGKRGNLGAFLKIIE